MSAWRRVFGVRHSTGLSEWLYNGSVLGVGVSAWRSAFGVWCL